MQIVIYGLACPLDGQVRYIGKSTNPARRLNEHINRALRLKSGTRACDWLFGLAAKGLRPKILTLRRVGDGECWRAAEQAEIATALSAGRDLVNATAGGEGFGCLRDDDEAHRRARISLAHSVRWQSEAIRPILIERNQALSSDRDVVGRRVETLRATLSRPEVAARKGRASSEVGARAPVKAARAEAARQLWANPSHQDQMASAGRALWEDPAYVAKVAAAIDAGCRDRMSKAAKARWADPEARARLLATQRTPEYRAKMAERTKAAWAKRRASKEAV